MAIVAAKSRSKQKLTRKEHIVPRLLLANFEDPAGILWVYSKDKPSRPSTAENECVENDFYEYELNGRKTNNKYEDWLARIETDATAVLRVLANRQQLTEREATIWAIFVAALFVRTRKVRTQISENMVREFKKKTEDPAFIRELQYELLQKGELVYADDIKKDVDKLRAAMEASPSFYHVSGLPRHTPDHQLIELFVLFWSRIVLRLVVPHCRPRPSQTYSHDLDAYPIGEIRRHPVHARSLLWSREKWNSQPIKNRLYLESVAHAPHGAELNQFAVFVVLVFVRRIGARRIVTGRIAEFRRVVLEESWRRLKLRRLKLRGSRRLPVLYVSLQPA